MRKLPAPTLDKLAPIVAELPEPFTLRDIMSASGMEENPARAALHGMKTRGWVVTTGVRLRHGNGSALWVRTHWYGVDRISAKSDMQRAALDLLGQCLSAWRIHHG